jgi:hypothetical protein
MPRRIPAAGAQWKEAATEAALSFTTAHQIDDKHDSDNSHCNWLYVFGKFREAP